jgi:hypothetical protein
VSFVEEVLIEVSAVNSEVARTGAKDHTRRGCLSPARA